MLTYPASWLNQDIDVATLAFPTAFKHEEEAYAPLLKLGQKAGCLAKRIDTFRQMGFPDIMYIYKSYHLLMEVKFTSKNTMLPSLNRRLTWQFGQLGFAQKMFEVGGSYALAVVHNNNIDLIYPGNEKKFCNRIVHILLDVAAHKGALAC